MISKYFQRIIYFACVLFCFQCANRGIASGGDKDTTPPEVVNSYPENFSTNFKGNEIRIFFDEYIKLKNLQKNLIISPPMDPAPEITPLGSASKYITIKIYDSLATNTTYAFNFGNSIEDNNEGNVLPFYRYVFSTGDNIDSLSINGFVYDALEKDVSAPSFVLLHEVDSNYNDSLIFKERPKYIGITDSLSQFKIENLRAGKYLLTALQEENSDYIYQPKKDKFAYNSNFIEIPSDTLYYLKLFKQSDNSKFVRAKQLASGRIGFGYEGDSSSIKITPILPQIDNNNFTISKEPEKDTLNFWYRPRKPLLDSLLFEVTSQKNIDTVNIKLRTMKKDSLSFKSLTSVLKLGENFIINSTIPVFELDPEKIRVINKDSISIKSLCATDPLNNRVKIKFEMAEDERYNIKLFPGALTDFYGNKNDTLNFSANTKSLSSYGNLRLSLRNANFPLIVQIVSKNWEVKAEKILKSNNVIDFIDLDPGTYYVRAIFDANNNGNYDPGNFLEGRQPEKVIYASEMLEVRAGWDAIEEFTLKN